MQDSFSCPTIVAVGFFGLTGADARRFSPFAPAFLARNAKSRAGHVGGFGGGNWSRKPADSRRRDSPSNVERRESCACEADDQALLAIGVYPKPLLSIVRSDSVRTRG
jgi:hypothetical protein